MHNIDPVAKSLLSLTDRFKTEQLSNLRPSPRNARKHGAEQIRKLKASIATFGFTAPVLADANGNILAGHARVIAAQELGMTEVPVLYLHHLTKEQARAYLVADNRLGELSAWDDNKLALELKGMSEMALDFEIEAVGFDAAEVDFRIQGIESADSPDRADDFQFAVGPTVSHIGDVWHLGDHRIVCGNSLDPATLSSLLAGKKAAAAFLDAPYNVRILGHATGNGATQHREFAMAVGEMSKSEFTSFLTSALRNVCLHASPGALLYATMDWRHMSEILNAGEAVGCELFNLAVWIKSNGGMGSFYRSRHELVFIFKHGSEPHQNNIRLGAYGRNRSNAWHYAGSNSFARKGSQRSLDLHPTPKPVLMVADAILDCTTRGEIVIDPFLGSGTTLIAAERTRRLCYGVELDPVYVDTTVERWQQMTNCPALSPLGETFDFMKAKRWGGS